MTRVRTTFDRSGPGGERRAKTALLWSTAAVLVSQASAGGAGSQRMSSARSRAPERGLPREPESVPTAGQQRDSTDRAAPQGEAAYVRLGLGLGLVDGSEVPGGVALVVEGSVGLHLSRHTVLHALVSPAFGLVMRPGRLSFGDPSVEGFMSALLGIGVGVAGHPVAPIELNLSFGPAYLGYRVEPRHTYRSETYDNWGLGYALGLGFPFAVPPFRIGPWVEWRESWTSVEGLFVFFPSGYTEEALEAHVGMLSVGAQISY